MTISWKCYSSSNRSMFLCMTKLKCLIATCVVAVAIVGCASQPIKEEDRNRDGTYDGNWIGTIARTPSKVNIENWIIRCWDMTGKLNVRVHDGKANMTWLRFNGSSYVSDDGKFSVIVPYREVLKSNPGNVHNLRHGMNVLLSGRLSDDGASGRLTMGYEDFANQGCSSKVAFAKS